MLHIGIVGCSAEGASLCYRTICAEGAARFGAHTHPEISLHTPPLSLYVECLERGDMDGVAGLMLASADILAGAGADFLICPDNTIHQAMHRVLARSPLPWLHIAGKVADAASEAGYGRVGVLGTRWLMESDVYPLALAARGVDCVKPGAQAQAAIHNCIMNQLVPGCFSEDSRELLRQIMTSLAGQGAEAVALACTEIPILFDGHPAPLPLLDSTRLLARAALDRAVHPL